MILFWKITFVSDSLLQLIQKLLVTVFEIEKRP